MHAFILPDFRPEKKGRPRGAAPCHICRVELGLTAFLLQFDGAAGILDLLLDLLGLVLVDAFLDRLGRAFDQRLRFAKAKARDGADLLDDVDLLATVAGENDVELGLLFGSGSRRTRGSRSSRNGGGSGNAPLLL